ncbi:methyltransferase domain-containing protein, partial [Candidatus Woesearchaeota archaeon]|nr:methyltransferase domain-containing protein [Candidatus Woesearchaeota archaeon]
MNIKLILQSKRGDIYEVKDISKDYQTKFGKVTKEQLQNAKDGDVIFSDHHEELTAYSPTFIDQYKNIKRLAQIPLLKDIGYIIAELGLGRDSVVVEGGSGSGGICCFLANIVKKIYSFDIEDEHIKVVKKNIENLNIKNVELKKQSLYEPIDIKNADAFILDVPEPWKAIETAAKALKISGFMISYSPNLIQVSEFVNTLDQDK